MEKKTLEQIVEENGIVVSSMEEWESMDGEIEEYVEEETE